MQCSFDCKPCCAFLATKYSCSVPRSTRLGRLVIPRSYTFGQNSFKHNVTSRNKPGRLVCFAKRDTKRQRLHKKQQLEKSNMVHEELIFFMFQMASLASCALLNAFDPAIGVTRADKHITLPLNAEP